MPTKLRRAAPVAVVLALLAVGLLEVATDHWRRGGVAFAAAAGVAAVLRLFVDDRSLLVVRGKRFDVLFLLGLAALFAAATYRP